MNRLNKYTGALLAFALTLGLAGIIVASPGVRAAGQPTVNLQTASPFAILAGTPAITDTGSSVIKGNIGLSPMAGSGITGLLCTQVTGTVYAVDATGNACFNVDGPLLVTAKNDLSAAYTDAAGRTPITTVATELGGTTKTAGVYVSGATNFQISNIGPLVLDGQGDPSAVFIFEAPLSAPGLTVGPGSAVSLINGAQACNVFWRVDSAAINTTATFKGNILALNSITVANGANVEGRLLARNGQVTLDNDTITVPTCAATTGGGSTGGTGTTAPKFPNAGIAPQPKTTPWSIILVASLVTAVGSVVAIRRKKLS